MKNEIEPAGCKGLGLRVLTLAALVVCVGQAVNAQFRLLYDESMFFGEENASVTYVSNGGGVVGGSYQFWTLPSDVLADGDGIVRVSEPQPDLEGPYQQGFVWNGNSINTFGPVEPQERFTVSSANSDGTAGYAHSDQQVYHWTAQDGVAVQHDLADLLPDGVLITDISEDGMYVAGHSPSRTRLRVNAGTGEERMSTFAFTWSAEEGYAEQAISEWITTKVPLWGDIVGDSTVVSHSLGLASVQDVRVSTEGQLAMVGFEGIDGPELVIGGPHMTAEPALWTKEGGLQVLQPEGFDWPSAGVESSMMANSAGNSVAATYEAFLRVQVPSSPVHALWGSVGFVWTESYGYVDLFSLLEFEQASFFSIPGYVEGSLAAEITAISEDGLTFAGEVSWYTEEYVNSEFFGVGVVTGFLALNEADFVFTFTDEWYEGYLQSIPTPGASGLLMIGGLLAARRQRG